MSASGLGALAGAVALLFGGERTLRRWLVGGAIGCSVGTLGLSWASHLTPAIASILVLSFSVSALMGRISQAIQHAVPNELRGRVMAVFTMTFTGLMPYAALALSALADRVGFARMLQFCVVMYVVSATIVLVRIPDPTRLAPATESAATG
jgi:hypothetical protein